MTLEATYFVSQIIAAIGVMASLVFVGLQIGQNTRATKVPYHDCLRTRL